MAAEGETARRLVITGGAGQIGRGFARRYRDTYELALLDLPGRFEPRDEELGELVEADVRDLDALKRAFAGADTVLHLGGHRSPASTWGELLPVNIVGTYNVVAAALATRASRVILASSVHAVSGYPAGRQVREEDPVNPGDLYGVSKAFGEALGRYAAEQEGLSFVALRIGAFQEPALLAAPGSGWMLEEYSAPEDVYELIRLCIEAPGIRFEIFNAASGNRFGRLSMDKARELLGFVPRHDAFRDSPAFAAAIAEIGGLAGPVHARGTREDTHPLVREAAPSAARSAHYNR